MCMNKCTENIVREIIREYFRSVLIEGKKPTGGLTGWFRDRWVDISRKKKGGGHPPCGASAGSKSRKGGKSAYPKCVPATKAASMSSKQKRSAITRKRKKGATGRGKAKMVSTYAKD
jgi:hypothetical protein